MFVRPLIADPEYANKIRDGRLDEIARCDRDNVCMRRMVMGMPIRCPVNPRMGRESRAPGKHPPVERLIKAPIEHAVLSATGSERIMSLAGRVSAAALTSPARRRSLPVAHVPRPDAGLARRQDAVGVERILHRLLQTQ